MTAYFTAVNGAGSLELNLKNNSNLKPMKLQRLLTAALATVLLLSVPYLISAQDGRPAGTTVRGVVVGDDGAQMIGATVHVRGPTIGAVTDSQGR